MIGFWDVRIDSEMFMYGCMSIFVCVFGLVMYYDKKNLFVKERLIETVIYMPIHQVSAKWMAKNSILLRATSLDMQILDPPISS